MLFTTTRPACSCRNAPKTLWESCVMNKNGERIKSAVLLLVLTLVFIIGMQAEHQNSRGLFDGNREMAPEPFDTGVALLPANKLKISVEGSTSIAGLLEVLAEAFMERHPDVKIDIMANGTNAAIKAVTNYNADLGMVSRELNSVEKSSPLKELQIAWDVLTIIVHPKNRINGLSKQQVSMIYQGQINNWSEFGGDDMPIHVISREEGSGTQRAFQSLFEAGNIRAGAQIAGGNGAVLVSVAGKTNAIGYVSYGFINRSVKAIRIDEIYPSRENTQNGSYKLKRPFLLIYMDNNKKEVVHQFIRFIESEIGRQIISERYVPFNY